MSELRHFCCTQCGKCCNRSPEVELSEAAALADMFVFRLMFRLYKQPRLAGDGAPGGSELFYQKKRLLALHAARKYSRKARRDGRAVEYSHYLMVSALAMDTRPGSCAALELGRCSIHERRPLGCRTVPLHYSRIEGLAISDFDAFVATPGFECDTSENAQPLIADGRIVDPETLRARADAAALAEQDRSWKEAIARRMKTGLGDNGLPSLDQVEASAHSAVLTSSMRIAWDIAVEIGLLSDVQARALGRLQVETIKRELALSTCSPEEARTLLEMRADYRSALAASPFGHPARGG